MPAIRTRCHLLLVNMPVFIAVVVTGVVRMIMPCMIAVLGMIVVADTKTTRGLFP